MADRPGAHVLRRDWNTLQPGDRVMVHHTADDETGSGLLPGVVASVKSNATGSNDLTVNLATPLGTRVVRPGRLSVHHDPIEFDSHCWRCGSGDDR